jgi:hypothetical protein
VATEQFDTSSAGRVLRVLAVSPTGRSAANCDLPLSGKTDFLAKSSRPSILTAQDERLLNLTSVATYMGSGEIGCKSNCKGWTYDSYGRVDPAITRIHFKTTNGATHDVPVTNGWYTLYWSNGDPKSRRAAVLTAYNAAGRVIKSAKIPNSHW